MQIHRFGDCAALALAGKGETRYMTAEQAETAAEALLAVAASIKRERFSASPSLTRSFETYAESWDVPRISARFPMRWAPIPKRYCVALYDADSSDSPVIYTQAERFEHRTLGAAVRRLASLIHRQGAAGYSGRRFGCLYVLTPNGERLPLLAARARLMTESANA